MGVEVVIASAAAISKVAISNGHCIHLLYYISIFVCVAGTKVILNHGHKGVVLMNSWFLFRGGKHYICNCYQKRDPMVLFLFQWPLNALSS